MSCCVVKEEAMFSYEDYCVYTKEEVLGYAERKRDEVEVHFFEKRSRRFAIIYTPDFCGMGHMEFYAMGRGFETFTSTGYRSIFTNSVPDAKKDDIESFVMSVLEREGVDFEKETKVQLSLF